MSMYKPLFIILMVFIFGFSVPGIAQAIDLTEGLSEIERAELDIEEDEEEAAEEEREEPDEAEDVEEPEEEEPSIFDIIDRRELSREIVFDPEKDRDVFVLPWVVDAVNATRLLVLGEGYLENEDYDQAISVFTRLISQHGGTQQSVLAEQKLAEAQELHHEKQLAKEEERIREEEEEVAIDPDKVSLPEEVKKQISAVIWDNNESYMLYGQDALRSGDQLPDFPDIIVYEFSEPNIYFQHEEETLSLEFDYENP